MKGFGIIIAERSPALREWPRKECRGRIVCFLATLLVACVGCLGPKRLGPVPAPITLGEAISRYNANVRAIPAWRARLAKWQIKSVNRATAATDSYQDIFGAVYYRPGQDAQAPSFYLKGETVLGEAFVVAANETEYWGHNKREKQGWWGKHIHVGKPCAGVMPIPTQLLLELVGLRSIPAGPQESLRALYKVRPEENVIEYIAVGEDGLRCREIIIDRRNDLPVEMNIYDQSGRRILHSTLGGYKTLGDAMLPGRIELAIYGDEYSMSMKLKLGKFGRDKKVRTGLFVRPILPPGIDDFQQIDRQCEDE